MNIRHSLFLLCFGCLIVTINISSCSKSSPDPSNPPPNDPCAGKTIVVTATPTSAGGCGSTGSITVTASGSSGFTYKLNSTGSYQASGTFTALAPGSYTVFARDAAGCEGSQAATVSASGGTPGVKFTAVKNLLTTRCVSCHSTANSQGGMNWTIDCNIVQYSARINARAVVTGDMPFGGPPLTTQEKAVITDWITAGGLLSN